MTKMGHFKTMYLGMLLALYLIYQACGQDPRCERRFGFPIGCESITSYNNQCEFESFLRYDDSIVMIELKSRNGRDAEGILKWIGIGFSLNAIMPISDCLMGWVEDDGTVTVSDRWAFERAMPPPDTILTGTMDLTDISGSFMDGITCLRFTRQRNTQDIFDIPLVDGLQFNIFQVYNGGLVTDPVEGIVTYHGASGDNIYIEEQISLPPFPECQPCNPNPCQNGGVCTANSAILTTCDCPDGFFGDLCEIEPCYPNPCKNGGTCTAKSVSDTTCDCPTGYFGDFCEIMDSCNSNPCQNGGSCMDSFAGFTCVCNNGFTGDVCQNAPGDKCGRRFGFPIGCESITSYNNQCEFESFLRYDDSIVMIELKSRNGRDAEGILKWIGIGFSLNAIMPISDCLMGWVENDGTVTVSDRWAFERAMPPPDTILTGTMDLTDISGSFMDGITYLRFTRQRNTQDIFDIPLVDGLQLNIFQVYNGGLVTDPVEGIVTYHGASGDNIYIEEQISLPPFPECLPDPCDPNPCLNGGMCMPDDNNPDSLNCNCINGYAGDRCQIPPDPCLSNPCLNGGSCMSYDSTGGFECTCVNGYTGDFCQIPLPTDPCSPNPCENWGTCIRGDGYYGSSGFTCFCTKDYTGPTCAEPIYPDTYYNYGYYDQYDYDYNYNEYYDNYDYNYGYDDYGYDNYGYGDSEYNGPYDYEHYDDYYYWWKR